MEFTLHKDFSSISAPEWNALVEEGMTDVPFLRYEYLVQWWATFGGGEWRDVELVLVSASENGGLIGIAPLFRAVYAGREALLLVGSIEISDYLDLIVRAADVGRFLSGLMDFLAQSPSLGRLPLDWYNLPDSSPTLAALQAESSRRNWTHQQEIYRPTPRIALRGDFDTFLLGLEKKQRHEIRRKLRRATESDLAVRFYLVEAPADLDSELEKFFQLMILDAGKAGFLTSQMREHLTAVAHLAFENGYLWLAFLEIRGQPAAAAFNFDYKNKIWGYNSGLSREHMELSPGWVLLGHQIEWACEHGRYEFDFMRGDEEYKYRFGGVNKYVMRVRVGPN
jgi:CelD/BcsL family acetyltransferase involved in cellulose biosynthesis